MYGYRKTAATAKRKRIMAVGLAAIAALAFFAGYCAGNANQTMVIYRNETRAAETLSYVPYVPLSENYPNASFSSIVVPAVDENGGGLTTVMTVQIIPGSGRVLADIDRLFFRADTQDSIRISSRVASNITGANLSGYDIFYTIEADAISVEGPSAGPALAIATIAALQKRKINPEVMITGTINPDGTIGQVGQILPKAKAAKVAGAKLLLVPLLQSEEIKYETREYCDRTGSSQTCATERVPKSVNISEESGIGVREIKDIKEALEYFFMED